MPIPTRYLKPEAIARLGSMELRARTIVEGFFSGQHKSPFRGASVEFADHREYTPGDDPRHLDWKVYGRTDRLYVKEYDAETNLLVHLVLDASGSMGYPPPTADAGRHGLSKLDYASHLAAALAYLAIKQRDMVGLLVFDAEVRTRLAPASSPSHLAALLERLEEAQPRGETRLSHTLQTLALSLKRRGLVILFSDLYDDPEAALRALGHFRHRGHDVAVFHLLSPAEWRLDLRGAVAVEDMETGECVALDADAVRDTYARELSAFVAAYRQGCRDRFVDYVPLDTGTPFELALARFLRRRAAVRR